MARPYEIGIYTQNDKLVVVLASSDGFINQGYNPILTNSRTEEKKLTFDLPIIYLTPQGQLVNNQLWYDELRGKDILKKDAKIKLIFDKLKQDNLGNYLHEIHEFYIEDVVERRDGRELICEISCIGAPFRELGQAGTELVLNLETVLLEEEKKNIQINPTLDYWMDKIFPSIDDPINVPWTYVIEMADNKFPALSTKVYENDYIIDWSKVGEELQPIYATEPLEKTRFVDIAEGTGAYNATQELAETFRIFVGYRFKYHADNPFKISKREVVFYDRFVVDKEYAINYGHNETGISLNENTSEIVTKMFVTPIESQYNDSGYVSIGDAKSNKTRDDFILNFDYYKDTDQLTPLQLEVIEPYESALFEYNNIIQKKSLELSNAQNSLALLEADLSNLRYSVISINEILGDLDEKLQGFDQNLETSVVKDEGSVVSVRLRDGLLYAEPRRKGALVSSFQVNYANGTEVPSNLYELELDSYQYVTKIVFSAGQGITEDTILRLSFFHDLLGFYRNERATQAIIQASTEEKIPILEEKILEQEGIVAALESELEGAQENKRTATEKFNNIMFPYLREGVWNDSDYKPFFQSIADVSFQIQYDPIPLTGEQKASYREGQATKYYHYIKINTPYPDEIENIAIMESFEEYGKPISRKLLHGAQVQAFYIYPIQVSSTYYNNIGELNSSNPDHGFGYKVLDGNKVYKWGGSSWVQENPIPAYVFISDKVKLDAAGHTFTINGVTVPNNQKVSGLPFTIAHQRIFFTDNGAEDGVAIKNIQASSIKPLRSGYQLREYEDYNVFSRDLKRFLALKINNFMPIGTSALTLSYKIDVSAEQFYKDALEVSRTSAYPKSSYTVNFTYLLNHSPLAIT